uniref:Uncharacterized protein n=1 Tax=Setaria viridis TaxID=4556 RepID=A0A4U6W8T5_SETVI|nr:hypothetical protein SEVIR_1G107100v2 [Setaria viridis]
MRLLCPAPRRSLGIALQLPPLLPRLCYCCSVSLGAEGPATASSREACPGRPCSPSAAATTPEGREATAGEHRGGRCRRPGRRRARREARGAGDARRAAGICGGKCVENLKNQ